MANKEIVQKINQSFADGNTEGFLSFCADDIEWTVVGEKKVKGKNEIRKWMASMGQDPPKFTVGAIIEEGDLVAAQGDMTMRDENKKTVPHSYCDIYRFRNGKVIELKSFVLKTDGKEQTTRKG
jgi:uncharacterized protein (TIGR02246 family)